MGHCATWCALPARFGGDKLAKQLVIVESPAKARTVERFLGRGYSVRACLGHIRDLPKSQLGVDVENGFAPKYIIPREKRGIVKELRQAAKEAERVYLATDPDREGEAISWHLVQATEIDAASAERVVFHEITQEAIKEAFASPRGIDMKLVEAQQARRILDRLVGYKVSPLLWEKVKRGLSAGRVQSVAVRLIAEREREMQGFQPQEYWTIEAELAKLASSGEGPSSFRAELYGLLGRRRKLEIPDREQADQLISELQGARYSVLTVNKKEVRREPAPPFTTSTLQQEASRQLRFSAKRTMAVAQQLYEGLNLGERGSMGLITYMRTDSTRVAASALAEARAYVKERFGAEFLPPSPRVFRKKAKGAQEAHEAIRPTSLRREPEAIRPHLTTDQFRLYQLIWKRMAASQMAAARLESTTVEVKALSAAGRAYLLRASASVLRFPGFLTLYREGRDEGEEESEERPLPPLAEGEGLSLLGLYPAQHFTQPPPRYTEASLVKALEEKGIGRPSTYAPILSTIQDRGYVQLEERRFRPTELGLLVNDLLVQHFPEIFDVQFTAMMEGELDEIARGERPWVPAVKDFYLPFQEALTKASEHIEKVTIADEPAGELCGSCGRPMVIKKSRYGRFIACSGFPQCRNKKAILTKIGVACPQCRGEIVQRRGRRGRPFYGCSRYPDCNFATGQRPVPQPCPHCGGLLVLASRGCLRCLGCGEQVPRQEREAQATGA